MIKIRYCGRMGNSLLQYGFARILSQELNQYLPPHPIFGFPITYKDVNVDKKNSEKDQWIILTRKNIWSIEEVKNMLVGKSNILMRSSCCNYVNFKPYRDKIRNEWFNICQPYNKNRLNLKNKFFIRNKSFSPIDVNNIDKDDLMINVRLGDIACGKHSSRLLTFDYFDIILRNIKVNRIFITSDSIDHKLLIPFDKYKPIYFFQDNYMETFNLVRLFKKIAISQSSYSWWVSYLSDAEEIYYPIVLNGPWVVDPKTRDEDLRVNEDRYIYVSQKHSKIMGKFNEVTEW